MLNQHSTQGLPVRQAHDSSQCARLALPRASSCCSAAMTSWWGSPSSSVPAEQKDQAQSSFAALAKSQPTWAARWLRCALSPD